VNTSVSERNERKKAIKMRASRPCYIV
jgi:hypothetical protein